MFKLVQRTRAFCSTTPSRRSFANLRENQPNLRVKKIFHLAQQPQTSLTLSQLYYLDKHRSPEVIINSAQYLRDEMPIRLSRRVMELENLKFGLAYKPAIQKTKELYELSVEDLLKFPEIHDLSTVEKFKELVAGIKKKHSDVVETMASDIVSTTNILQPSERLELDQFLDGFYGSRIGIRTMMGQFISVVDNKPGIIQKIKPAEVFKDAKEDVSTIAEIVYGECPPIEFVGDNKYEFTYIPAFLHYIYLEVLKNAVRATMQKYEDLTSAQKESIVVEPIKITQSQGIDDLIVKISDGGESFPREMLPQVYSYSFTTVKDQVNPSQTAMANGMPIIAGLGYGVPLARLYASYFGGELQILPFYGVGTDVIIYIHRLMKEVEKEY